MPTSTMPGTARKKPDTGPIGVEGVGEAGSAYAFQIGSVSLANVEIPVRLAAKSIQRPGSIEHQIDELLIYAGYYVDPDRVGIGMSLAGVSALTAARLRNSSLGIVELEVVREGKTRIVEVSRDRYQQLVSDGGDAEEVLEEIG